MRTSRISVCVAVAYSLFSFASIEAFGAEEVDFTRDIRPLLSDNCYACHGPDSEKRQADLRLDTKQGAVDSSALVPGDANASELFQRIISTDPEKMMPPRKFGKKLSATDIEKIKQWINQGGKYDEHWAFVAPKRPQVPTVPAGHRVTNAIDNFVGSQLPSKKLKQSPAANRETLVRRIFLDLIGLPPTPDQLKKWTSVKGDDWVSQLTEELLKSPHFGERWARWWLDAARYADSDGYEKDKPREVWFYRDWVIHAMNDDMPYDQFIIRQIAGDLLPKATQADRVATGFLRNSMVNEEGGADPEQFRVEGMFDRLDAIGKSILGITTQCAQCHSHKYDPLTQEEYYSMFAALNNFHEATLCVYTPEQEAKREQVTQAIKDLEKQAQATNPNWSEAFQQWYAKASKHRPEWQVLIPTELPWEGQKFRPLEDHSIISESYAPTRNDITFPCDLAAGTYTAVRLDLLTHPQLPLNGPGRSIYGTGALTQFDVSIPDPMDANKKLKLKIKRAVADVNPPQVPLPSIYRDKDPTKDDRVTGPVEMAIDDNGKTAWSTDIGPGRRNQNRHAIFELETPLEVKQPTQIFIRMVQNHGGWNSDDNQNYLIGRFRFSITEHGAPVEHDVPSVLEPLLGKSNTNELSPEQRQELFSHWRTTQDAFAKVNTEIEELWKQYPAGASQLAVIESEKPRETFVMLRGDFLKRGPKVKPGQPSFLNPVTNSNEPARLQLARWLVDRKSPTTARVIVNRVWQAYFGRGLVTTPEDFGRQSPAPSHPEMLDWLSVELMENNWSLKHLHRLIVNSQTYQQSSNATEEQLSADRFNEWLGRGPRFRLDAELVRDVALSVSGLLNEKVGGPSIYPPAPGFLFEPPASYGPKVWRFEANDQQYRRSLYVHTFRSVPYTVLQVFDAPKGDAACPARQRSNTPMQALVVLNEPQFVDFARAFAMRILRDTPTADDRDRIAYAFSVAVGRQPDTLEVSVLEKLLSQQRARLKAGEMKEATALLGASDTVVRQLTGHSADELIPWVVVARAILNLDETITKG